MPIFSSHDLRRPRRSQASALVELTALPEAEAAAAWHRSASAAERERAGFRSEALRRRHAHAHGALRLVLAGATGTAPERIAFLRDAAGRPFVAGAPDFSLSYCGARAWLLIGDGAGRVGLDVVDAGAGGPPLDSAIAGADERHAVGPCARPDLLVWAAKEAAAKLTGAVARDPSAWRVTRRRALSVESAGFAPIPVRFLALPGGATAALAGRGLEAVSLSTPTRGRIAA